MRTLLEALRATRSLDQAAALLLALGPGLDASRGQYGPEHLEVLGDPSQPATLKVRVRSGVAAELGPFQAPEVAWGRGGSAAVAYLIAALLYERLTGVVPFPDAPPEALQVRKLLEPVPTVPPEAPDHLAELIPHALQPQVEERLPLADLRHALAVVAGHHQPAAAPRPRALVLKERVVASAADEHPSMHAELLAHEAAPPPADPPGKGRRALLVGVGLAAAPLLLGGAGLLGAGVAAALSLAGLIQSSWMVSLAVGLASLGLVALGLALGAAGLMLTPAPRALPPPPPPPPAAPLPAASSSPSIFDESSIAADPPEDGFRPFAIGPYWCFGRVGEGAMGVVYRSRHMRLGRLAAVKVLAPQVALHASNVAWFKREARLAARIRHPNVVQIYDFGAIDGQLYYIAMEHVDGVPLTERLASGPLPLRDVAAIVAQVGAGLDAAHASGVIHRDLKPANIVVASRGASVVATIVDFGIARQGGGSSSDTAAMVMGTPPYMSPEQARGEADLDARTDVFALGVLAYELLTGQLPFGTHADRPVKALLERGRLGERPPRARALRPEIAPAADEALVKALAPERSQRAATAGAFAEELRRGLG